MLKKHRNSRRLYKYQARQSRRVLYKDDTMNHTATRTMLIEHHGYGFTSNDNAILLMTGIRYHLVLLLF